MFNEKANGQRERERERERERKRVAYWIVYKVKVRKEDPKNGNDVRYTSMILNWEE